MIESFVIFTRGGLVLFSHGELKLPGNPLFALVSQHLVSERAGAAEFTHGDYTAKWRLDNDKELVYVVSFGLIVVTFAFHVSL